MTKRNNHPVSEIQICPDCKGKSTIERFIRTEHSRGSIYNTETCDRCQGSGRVVVTVITKEEAYKDENYN